MGVEHALTVALDGGHEEVALAELRAVQRAPDPIKLVSAFRDDISGELLGRRVIAQEIALRENEQPVLWQISVIQVRWNS